MTPPVIKESCNGHPNNPTSFENVFPSNQDGSGFHGTFGGTSLHPNGWPPQIILVLHMPGSNCFLKAGSWYRPDLIPFVKNAVLFSGETQNKSHRKPFFVVHAWKDLWSPAKNSGGGLFQPRFFRVRWHSQKSGENLNSTSWGKMGRLPYLPYLHWVKHTSQVVGLGISSM